MPNAYKRAKIESELYGDIQSIAEMSIPLILTGLRQQKLKDPQFSAVIISQRGSVPYERIEGDRVELEPIPIAVWVKIPVLEIAVRRFNILDRKKAYSMFAVDKNLTICWKLPLNIREAIL